MEFQGFSGLPKAFPFRNKGIARIFDNSKIKYSPQSSDLSFIIGPQLNSASRINDSSAKRDLTFISVNDSSQTRSKLRKYDQVNIGLLRYNNMGEASNIYTDKAFISFDKKGDKMVIKKY